MEELFFLSQIIQKLKIFVHMVFDRDFLSETKFDQILKKNHPISVSHTKSLQ